MEKHLKKLTDYVDNDNDKASSVLFSFKPSIEDNDLIRLQTEFEEYAKDKNLIDWYIYKGGAFVQKF
jgi:hypothetical protein